MCFMSILNWGSCFHRLMLSSVLHFNNMKFSDKTDIWARWIIVAMVPALLYSRSVTTLGMAAILIASATVMSYRRLYDFVRNPEYALFTLVFVGVALSGINSTDKAQWLHHLNIKLPFLIMPLSIYLLDRFQESWVRRLHQWFVLVMMMAFVPVAIWIMGHYQEIIGAISRGQPVPTPIGHVMFSMLNAYAVTTAAWLYLTGKDQDPWKNAWLAAGVWIFILMHLVAVRTGLVIVYASLAVLAFHFVRSKFRFIVLLAALGFIGISTIRFIPTLNQKWAYVQYDWEMFRKDGGKGYSDSDRWVTLQAGWQLFKSYPLMGTGIGDFRRESTNLYASSFERSDLRMLPHNQFLHMAGSGGVVGLAIFLTGFFGPLIVLGRNSPLMLKLLYLNFGISFLVENSVERSATIAFFLLFALSWVSSRAKQVRAVS